MRRTSLFIIVTIVSLVSLVAVVVAGFYTLTSNSNQYPTGSDRWGGMWSGMMGGMWNSHTGNYTTQTQNAAGSYFGIAFVVLIGVAIAGISGLIYFFAFPEIRNPQPHMLAQSSSITSVSTTSVPLPTAATPFDSVFKTLTNDERKVIEVLSAHNGKYLQKYIRNEASLSRLQTHRIVARLAERGIVSLEKTGNTNTVLLANWLNP